jgi:hypothetical protein
MRRALAVALAVVSCAHEGPFTPASYTPGQPAGSGSLVRLTFNLGQDLAPAWLPDGSGFLYTIERRDRPDLDRCLARMPAAGGSIEREICNLTAASGDSVDAYSAAVVSAAGRLAYVRASAPIGFSWPLSPRRHDLVLATLTDARRVTVLESFPVAAPSGHDHDEAAQIRWLSDQALIYLAQSVKYVAPCQTCGRDTITIGVEIARLDLTGAVPALSILPGTDSASSFTTVGSDTVYFTVIGDSRVFRLALGSGALDVAHDFGAGALPRDVQVAGNRLVAVVGGHMEIGVDSALGPIVRDRGGEVHVVDLPSGVDQVQSVTDMLFRHLALDPTGHILIAEGYPIFVFPPDTTFSTVSDLWRFELP